MRSKSFKAGTSKTSFMTMRVIVYSLGAAALFTLSNEDLPLVSGAQHESRVEHDMVTLVFTPFLNVFFRYSSTPCFHV